MAVSSAAFRWSNWRTRPKGCSNKCANGARSCSTSSPRSMTRTRSRASIWPVNPGKDVKEFITKIYHVRADPSQREALDSATAGDIVAVIGPKESVTGDTICDVQHPILLEPIRFAETVVSRSIEPESSAD